MSLIPYTGQNFPNYELPQPTGELQEGWSVNEFVEYVCCKKYKFDRKKQKPVITEQLNQPHDPDLRSNGPLAIGL